MGRKHLRSWLAMFAVCTASSPAVAEQICLTPAAVPFSSGPGYPSESAAYAAERAIDGDLATFCCLLDDSLTGTSDQTIPPRAAAPVTGYMIFDLGRRQAPSGVRLTARHNDGAYNPQDVDFFYYADDDPRQHPQPADLEHDPKIIPLAANRTLPPLPTAASPRSVGTR